MHDASSFGDPPSVQLFDSHVTAKIQRACLKTVLENYKNASAYCYANFQASQAKDLSGGYQRALIEEEWAGVAAIFKEINVGIRLYENNTGSYNEITCGRVKLTQSCTLSPNDAPRRAYFRTSLASNGQMSIFTSEDEVKEEARKDAYLYAILTHGVDTESPKRSRPYFVRIQFPNDSCTGYVDDGIDLLKRFPDVAAEYYPQGTPEVNPDKRDKRKFGTNE